MVNITNEILDELIGHAGKAREIDERIYRLNKEVGGDPFTAGYSTSRLRWGPTTIADDIGDVVPAFRSRERALQMSRVIGQGAKPEEAFGGLFGVMERTPSAYGETGFSHLTVGRKRFREVMALTAGDSQRQLDALEMMLTYTDASLQTELVGRKRGPKRVSIDRSRNVTAPDYVRQQARSMQKMLTGEITSEDMRNAFVFDIETANLYDEAGIHQIAYSRQMRNDAGELIRDDAGRVMREQVEILFDNPMMETGNYVLPDGTKGSYREWLAAKKGVGVEDLDFKSLHEGLLQFFEDVSLDDTKVLSGQNVKFDIQKLLAEGEKILNRVHPGSDELQRFEEVYKLARSKMLGDDAADIVDYQSMMRLLMDHEVDPSGIGGGRALSQEAVSGYTSLLEDARKWGAEEGRSLLGDDTWDKLVKIGLHDAAVDIDVSRAIGVLQHAILTGAPGSDELMRQIGVRGRTPEGAPVWGDTGELDPAVQKSLRESGAVIPTTTMPGEMGMRTPFTELVQGSRKFMTPAGDLDFYGLLYEGSRYNYNRIGAPTRDAFQRNLDATGARGFYNPDFTSEISGRPTADYLDPSIEGTPEGETVQGRLFKMNAPFAHLSEPERMLGELLNQSSLGHPSSRYAADFGINYYKAFREDSGRMFTQQFKNVAIDPRFLGAMETLADEGAGPLSAVRSGKGLVSRLSELQRENKVAVLLDLFQDGQDETVESFVDEVQRIIKGAAGDDAEIKKALIGAGYDEDEIAILTEAMTTEEIERLRGELLDPTKRRYGQQIGIYEDVKGAAEWMGSFTPEREEAKKINRLFGQYLEELPTGTTGRASLPILGIEHMLQQARAGQARIDKGRTASKAQRKAIEELRSIEANAAASGKAGKRLSDELGVWWKRSFAERARDTGDGARAHRMTSFVQGAINKTRATFKTPRNRWMLGAAVIAGITGAKLAGEDEPHAATLVQGAYGYERQGAYADYKASIGETPAADYSTNPVIRRPPTIDTVGVVQDLHDNRTGHHNMDRTTKYAHLFGY